MEESNVNNLNGVPNMGHGVDEAVVASNEPAEVEPNGEVLNESTTNHEENVEEGNASDVQEDVADGEAETQKDNG